MALPIGKQRCTYADYLTWDEGERVELIEGCPVRLDTPPVRHQAVSVEMTRQLAGFLEGKTGEVYHAPLGVRLFEQDGDRPDAIDTVALPDLFVVCDPRRLDTYGCKGAPELVIEILSPSTQRHDRLVKLNLYQRAGVKEYWIVNPEDQTVQVMLHDGNSLQIHEIYGRDETAKVNALEDCFIDLRKVFPET